MLEIGVDIVRIHRIESLLNLYGNKFLEKIYVTEEIKDAEEKGHLTQSLAGKFAAKEAFIKASSNYWNQPLFFIDIIVLSDKKGKPYIKNTVNSKLSLPCNIHVSISHEKEYAVAVVAID